MAQDQVTLTSVSTALAGFYAELQQAALSMDVDTPTPEEERDTAAYTARLATVVELRHPDACQAAEIALSTVLRADALPWSPLWFGSEVGLAAFGLSRQAMAYRDLTKYAASSVASLGELGLYQAAWFRANDALYFGGLFFGTSSELAKLAGG